MSLKRNSLSSFVFHVKKKINTIPWAVKIKYLPLELRLIFSKYIFIILNMRWVLSKQQLQKLL